MPNSASIQLLTQLEPLSHQERTRRMIEFGKESGHETVLVDLEVGNIYERQLALMTCFSSRDSARVKLGFSDASKVIRGLAIALAPIALSDADLLEVLRIIPRQTRLVLLHAFARHKRSSVVIDQFFQELVQNGNTRDATELMGFVSITTLEQHLAILELASIFDLVRLARTQPQMVADWLEAQALAATELNVKLTWQVDATIGTIANYSAPRALQLVRAIMKTANFNFRHSQALLKRCPKEIADLVLEIEDSVFSALDFSPVAHRLEPEQLQALQNKFPSTFGQLESYLKRFPVSARNKVFEIFKSDWANAEGLVSPNTLSLLPRIERETQAKRHLEHPALAARPVQRLPYAKLLSWDEAAMMLEPAIKHPKPEQRITAIPALIYTARYDREKYGKVLEFARFRKNEQDPVRLIMINAIADLPPSGWKVEHLESLGQVLQETLDRADLSGQTAAAAERLVVRVLPFFMDWGAKWIGILVKQRGSINLYNIGRYLSEEHAVRIAKSLLPVLKTWVAREREDAIIGALFHFGKRLQVLPEFLDLAEGLVKTAYLSRTSPYALTLISEYDKKRFNRLVPELLEDQSWATIPVVYQYLHRHRQDLLTPFLGQTAYKGRFSTGKTRFVLPLQTGFNRWNSKQQAMFVKTLDEVARDQDQSIPTVLQVLVQLSAIPNAAATTIERLARLDNTRLAIRDAALRALGRLDEARGLEPLLSALDDDRARVAIYALRRLLLFMSPEQALMLLKRAPLERVTVGKEVLRLVGELKTESAYAHLLEANQQILHRDVRVALLRGLWDYLEKPQTWEIFQLAAQSYDPAIADGVILIPTERLSDWAEQNLISLLVLLIAHPDPEVRLKTLDHCWYLCVADTGKRLLPALLHAIRAGIPKQTQAAALALFRTYSAIDSEIIGQMLLDILQDRRTLREVVNAFLETICREDLRIAQAILDALKIDVLTLGLQTEIVVCCFQSLEIARFLIDLNEQGHFNADIYQIASSVLTEQSSRRGRRISVRKDLATLETTLREHPNELLRRFGLVALKLNAINAYGHSTAWTPEQLALLERYRQDPSNLVASGAQFTFPTIELEKPRKQR